MGSGLGPEQHPCWALPGPLPPPDWASAVLGPGQGVHWRTQKRERVSQPAAGQKNKAALTSGELLHRGKVTTAHQVNKHTHTHTSSLTYRTNSLVQASLRV